MDGVAEAEIKHLLSHELLDKPNLDMFMTEVSASMPRKSMSPVTSVPKLPTSRVSTSILETQNPISAQNMRRNAIFYHTNLTDMFNANKSKYVKLLLFWVKF